MTGILMIINVMTRFPGSGLETQKSTRCKTFGTKIGLTQRSFCLDNILYLYQHTTSLLNLPSFFVSISYIIFVEYIEYIF